MHKEDNIMRGLKKASDILFTISEIYTYICAGLFFLFAIFHIVVGCGVFNDLIRKGLEEGSIHSDWFNASDIDGALLAIQITFIACGVVLAIMGILAIINGVIIHKTKKGQSRGLYILNIVFGYLSGCYLNIVAAIFGLITFNKVR